jgi:dihydrolipoamide dehydrogenase
VTWEGGEETFRLGLAATGRVPNVDGLGLETTGLVLDRRGVPLYDARTLRCAASSIFIAGDANADVPVLHEAADEGRIAGENAARLPDVRPGLRRSPLSVVFSDPNIALVGETWAQVKDRDPIVGRVSFDDQGRSRVMRQNRGLLHVYAERFSGRLLGAEMVAPRGEHLAHALAWAHQQGLTIHQILDLPFYHPVVEEGVRTALRDAAAQLTR